MHNYLEIIINKAATNILQLGYRRDNSQCQNLDHE